MNNLSHMNITELENLFQSISLLLDSHRKTHAPNNKCRVCNRFENKLTIVSRYIVRRTARLDRLSYGG